VIIVDHVPQTRTCSRRHRVSRTRGRKISAVVVGLLSLPRVSLLDHLIRLPRRVIIANLLLPRLPLMPLEVVIHLRVTMPLVGATIKITAMGMKIKEHLIMDMVMKTPAPPRKEAMAFPTFLLLVVVQTMDLVVLPNLRHPLADNPRVLVLSGAIVEAAAT